MNKQMSLSAFNDELAQIRTKKKVFLNILLSGTGQLDDDFIYHVGVFALLNNGDCKCRVIHCLVISVSLLPIAYCMYWMPHSFLGISGYIVIIFFIYFFIWFAQYFAMKKRIQELNDKVKQND